jgi:hypothetical protein
MWLGMMILPLLLLLLLVVDGMQPLILCTVDAPAAVVAATWDSAAICC